jgi:hypothetical protein
MNFFTLCNKKFLPIVEMLSCTYKFLGLCIRKKCKLFCTEKLCLSFGLIRFILYDIYILQILKKFTFAVKSIWNYLLLLCRAF